MIVLAAALLLVGSGSVADVPFLPAAVVEEIRSAPHPDDAYPAWSKDRGHAGKARRLLASELRYGQVREAASALEELRAAGVRSTAEIGFLAAATLYLSSMEQEHPFDWEDDLWGALECLGEDQARKFPDDAALGLAWIGLELGNGKPAEALLAGGVPPAGPLSGLERKWWSRRLDSVAELRKRIEEAEHGERFDLAHELILQNPWRFLIVLHYDVDACWEATLRRSPVEAERYRRAVTERMGQYPMPEGFYRGIESHLAQVDAIPSSAYAECLRLRSRFQELPKLVRGGNREGAVAAYQELAPRLQSLGLWYELGELCWGVSYAVGADALELHDEFFRDFAGSLSHTHDPYHEKSYHDRVRSIRNNQDRLIDADAASQATLRLQKQYGFAFASEGAGMAITLRKSGRVRESREVALASYREARGKAGLGTMAQTLRALAFAAMEADRVGDMQLYAGRLVDLCSGSEADSLRPGPRNSGLVHGRIVLSHAQEYDEAALSLLARAAESAAGRPHLTTMVGLHRAARLLDMDRVGEAREIARAIPEESPPEAMWQRWTLLAMCARRTGTEAEAEAAFDSATTWLASVKRSLASRSTEQFALYAETLYDEYIAFELDRGEVAAAFLVEESSRGRVLTRTGVWPPEVSSVEDLARTLHPDEMLLHCRVEDEGVRVWSLVGDDMQHRFVPISSDELLRLTERARKEVQEGVEEVDACRRLGALFLSEERLSTRGRILLVPDGCLATVPWEAFVVGEEPAFTRWTLAYLLSAGQALVSPASPPDGGLLAVGYNGGSELLRLKRLRFAEQEAADVSALRPGSDLLLGRDVTAENLASAAAGRSIVHIANHVGSDATGRAFLVVEPSEGCPSGLLAGAQLGELPWAEGVTVVLSSCHSSRSDASRRARRVGEAFALGTPLFAAGAGGVVATLWDVDDEKNAERMTELYSSKQSPGRQPDRAALPTLGLVHWGRGN